MCVNNNLKTMAGYYSHFGAAPKLFGKHADKCKGSFNAHMSYRATRLLKEPCSALEGCLLKSYFKGKSEALVTLYFLLVAGKRKAT